MAAQQMRKEPHHTGRFIRFSPLGLACLPKGSLVTFSAKRRIESAWRQRTWNNRPAFRAKRFFPMSKHLSRFSDQQ